MKMYPMSQIDPIRHLNKHIKNREVTKKVFDCAVRAVELVRQTIGAERELLVDVTAEGTTDMMWRFGQAIEPYNIFWYEEAMDAFDVDAYRTIRDKVNIPLATGERLYTRYGISGGSRVAGGRRGAAGPWHLRRHYGGVPHRRSGGNLQR